MKGLIYFLAVIGGLSVLAFVFFLIVGIVNSIRALTEKDDELIVRKKPNPYVLKKRR